MFQKGFFIGFLSDATIFIFIIKLYRSFICSQKLAKRRNQIGFIDLRNYIETRNSRRFAPFFLALEGASRPSSKLVVNMFVDL